MGEARFGAGPGRRTGIRHRRRHHYQRVIAPLLFDDPCVVWGKFLLPREVKADTPLGCRLPPGWLSEHLAPAGRGLMHIGCRTA